MLTVACVLQSASCMTCTQCPTTLEARWAAITRRSAGTPRWASGTAITTPGEPHVTLW